MSSPIDAAASSDKCDGPPQTCSSPHPAAKSVTVDDHALFTPAGLLVRFTDCIDSTINYLESKQETNVAFVSRLYSIVLTFPFRVCKSVCMQLERLLGVKHRMIITASRRSSKQRSSKQVAADSEPVAHEGFVFDGEPCANVFHEPKSPGKRRAIDDAEQEEEEACESDSDESQNESFSASQNGVKGYLTKLLNLNDTYKSEDDPDFDADDLEDESGEEEDGFDEGDLIAGVEKIEEGKYAELKFNEDIQETKNDSEHISAPFLSSIENHLIHEVTDDSGFKSDGTKNVSNSGNEENFENHVEDRENIEQMAN